MKKGFLAVFVVFLCLGALAQGKVTIQNDDAHLVVFDTITDFLEPADASLAGQPVPTTGALPSGGFLVFGLYAGTSPSTMTLVTAIPAGQTIPAVVPINSTAGSGLPAGWITPTHALLPFEGGTLASMQIRVWDAQYPSYEAANGRGYLGESLVFNMTPGLSTKLTYPGINNGGGTTWAGPIVVTIIIPEPSTFALGGLGAAALLIFRRRRVR